MNTNSAEIALKSIYDLIEKSDSCNYLLRLSLIFFRFFNYKDAHFCIQKGLDISKTKGDIKFEINLKITLK